MKKLFYLFAVAVVAISLASCNKKDEPASKDFAITVSDVTATSAHVKITPSKEDAFYYASVVSQEGLDYYKMTIEEYAQDDMDYYSGTGASFANLAQSGEFEGDVELQPETKYYAYAFYFNKNWEILSDVAYVTFTTPKLEITETIDLALAGAEVTWEFYATDGLGVLDLSTAFDEAKGLGVNLSLVGETANGTFTENNLYDPYAAYGYYSNCIYDANKNIVALPVLAQISGAFNADSTVYTYGGYVVDADGVKYTFNNVQATPPAEEEGGEGEGGEGADGAAAPAKKFARKLLKK